MTWAERTREEGREEGLDALRRLLAAHLERVGDLTDEMRDRIETADQEQLSEWMQHVLSTATGTVTVVAEGSDS